MPCYENAVCNHTKSAKNQSVCDAQGVQYDECACGRENVERVWCFLSPVSSQAVHNSGRDLGLSGLSVLTLGLHGGTIEQPGKQAETRLF